MKTYDERTQSVLDMVGQKKRRRRIVVAAISSSCACIFVLVLGLVLFLPFQTPQTGDAYQKVVNAVYQEEYHNNWQLLAGSLDSKKTVDKNDYVGSDTASNRADIAMESDIVSIGKQDSISNASSTSVKTEEYVENTNLQVLGIKEGDVLKESTNYFYRIRSASSRSTQTNAVDDAPMATETADSLQLDVFRKAGFDTQCVATYQYRVTKDMDYIYTYQAYLDDACTTLTLLFDGDLYYPHSGVTGVVQLDVSDLAQIRVVAERFVSGTYCDSRMVDGRIILLTHYYVWDYTYEDPTTYIPYIEDDNKCANTAPDQIMCPERAQDMQFSVLTMFDDRLEPAGQTAMLGYSDSVFYVNHEHAYVVCNNVRSDAKGSTADVTCMSISREGLRMVGNFEIEGNVGSQYWLDEEQGVFRVVATIRDYSSSSRNGNNASLYCYRTSDWTLIGKVERFAPEGESVQSVRFAGSKVYVCTAVVFTDPVFCFDLSDYSHITYTDTGTINGYSFSLIPFTDGTMLGVGVDERNMAKIELYRETDRDVQSLSRIVLGEVDEAGYSVRQYTLYSDYKSYYIDAANGIIGIPCTVYSETYDDQGWRGQFDNCRYVFIAYRDGALRVVNELSMATASRYGYFRGYAATEYARAASYAGFVYLFTSVDNKVVSISDMQ